MVIKPFFSNIKGNDTSTYRRGEKRDRAFTHFCRSNMSGTQSDIPTYSYSGNPRFPLSED